MTNWDSTLPTIAAGAKARASDIATLVSLMTALTDEWTDWSSSFTIGATTTAPTMGSSVKTARYKMLGNLVIFNFSLTVTTGGAWNAGSGSYNFPVPTAADSAARKYVGSAFANDSGTALRVGVCRFDADVNNVRVFLNDGTNVALSSSGPGSAWATGDYVDAQILYEAA